DLRTGGEADLPLEVEPAGEDDGPQGVRLRLRCRYGCGDGGRLAHAWGSSNRSLLAGATNNSTSGVCGVEPAGPIVRNRAASTSFGRLWGSRATPAWRPAVPGTAR